MSGWIIGLDKHLEVFPVGVGENFQRCVAKCILEVIGPEAKEACWSYYLYGGMEAGFEGRIHEMQFLCQQHIQEESWGFLLIDERNSFNEDIWTALMWTFQYKWPNGMQLKFHFCRYWANMVIWDAGGTGPFLFSKE